MRLLIKIFKRFWNLDMNSLFKIYVTNTSQKIEQFPLSAAEPLPEEVTHVIAESDKPIVLCHNGLANTHTLDELFLILNQLYRPLMRKRGCQFWVFWQQSNDTIIQKGAQTLCQIAAMELAGKKARINFVSCQKAMDTHAYLELIDLKGCEYLTAQSLQWQNTHTNLN